MLAKAESGTSGNWLLLVLLLLLFLKLLVAAVVLDSKLGERVFLRGGRLEDEDGSIITNTQAWKVDRERKKENKKREGGTGRRKSAWQRGKEKINRRNRRGSGKQQ